MTSRAGRNCGLRPALTDAQERARRRWRIALLMAGLALVMAVSLLLPGKLLGAETYPAYSVETVPNVHLNDRNNYVSNPDGLLSAGAVSEINRIVGDLQRTYGVEVAVVAVRSIGDNDAREFANELFRHWGVGRRGKDSGLLIQLVTEPPQRSVVFETGYGLEGVLPDAIAYRLQQRYMLPDLQQGDYSAGMLKGVAAVSDYLKGSELERTAMLDAAPGQGEEGSPLMTAGGIIGLLILFFVFRKNPAALAFLLSIFLRGGGGGPGGSGGGSWGGGRSGGGGSISRF